MVTLNRYTVRSVKGSRAGAPCQLPWSRDCSYQGEPLSQPGDCFSKVPVTFRAREAVW